MEFDLDGSPLRTSPVLNIEERGRSHARPVMTPRASVSANANAGNSLAATFPSAPLPVPVAKPPVAAGKAAAAKPAPSATHKAKSSRWLFRRRPRLTTAERNAAQLQAQEARSATSGVTTKAPELDDKRLAR